MVRAATRWGELQQRQRSQGRGDPRFQHRMGVVAAAGLAHVSAQRPLFVHRVGLDVGKPRGAAALAQRQQKWIARKVHFALLSNVGGRITDHCRPKIALVQSCRFWPLKVGLMTASRGGRGEAPGRAGARAESRPRHLPQRPRAFRPPAEKAERKQHRNDVHAPTMDDTR